MEAQGDRAHTRRTCEPQTPVQVTVDKWQRPKVCEPLTDFQPLRLPVPWVSRGSEPQILGAEPAQDGRGLPVGRRLEPVAGNVVRVSGGDKQPPRLTAGSVFLARATSSRHPLFLDT